METDPWVGRTIGGGRYELVSRLGQGGMGRVYAAWQREVGRQVVVKLIHAHLVTDPDIVLRLRQEMQLTAKVEHPNTIRLYDVGEENGQPFLVTELLRGQTLGALLHAEGPLPPRRIAMLGVQIARGLRAIHAAGVVHRDLKPDNVMVVSTEAETDQVKILDFGIARPLAAAAGKMTLAGRLIGTPLYMSPEQASGRTVDPRSDLYSLGIVLYELATGAPPFMGETPVLLHAHVQTEPRPVSFASGDSPELGALIMLLLAKSPDARPASATEVVHTLERVLAASTGPVSGLTGTFVSLKSEPALVMQPAAAPPPAVAPAAAPVAAPAALPVVSSAAPVPPPAGSPALAVPDADRSRPRGRRGALLFGTAVALGLGAAFALGWPRWRTRVAPEAVPGEASGAARGALPDAASENARGNALQRQGRLPEAEDAYRRALVASPGYVPSRFNLGLLALRRGDADAARVAFDAIASEQPDHPGVFLARAEAHRQLGHRDASRADLEEHVRRHPRDAEGWLHLARSRQSRGEETAVDAFCRARDLGSPEAARSCPATE